MHVQPDGQLSPQSNSSLLFSQGLKKYAYKGTSNSHAAPTPPGHQSPEVVEITDSPPGREKISAEPMFLGFIDLTGDSDEHPM